MNGTLITHWLKTGLIAAMCILGGSSLAEESPPAEQWQQGIAALMSGQQQTVNLYLHFGFNQDKVTKHYQQRLQELTRSLYPLADGQLSIVIKGHTDAIGSSAYNLGLSQRRAEAVLLELRKLMPEHHLRLNTSYFGKTVPIANNNTPEGRAINRRVELTLSLLYPRQQNRHSASTSFTSDGRSAFTADDQGQMTLWQLDNACPQYHSVPTHSAVLNTAISPNGRLAASGHLNGRIRLWDLLTGRELKTYYNHDSAVVALSFNHGGDMLISASQDGYAGIVDLNTHRSQSIKPKSGQPLSTLAVSHDDRFLALGDISGTVSLWNLATRNQYNEYRLAQGHASIMAFANHGNYLALASNIGELIMMNDDMSQPRRFSLDAGKIITALAFTPDGHQLVTAHRNTPNGQSLVKWDSASGRALAVAHNDQTTHRLHISPNSRLIMGAGEHSLSQWDLDTLDPVHSFSLARQAAEPQRGQPGEIWHEPNTGIPFVWVEGGCYKMGCQAGSQSCARDEYPAHEVCVEGFWMAQTELTQEQWLALNPNNPSRYTLGGDHPVEQVSWFDAQNFACQLNGRSGYEFRLPTEAEFEYACRNGGQNTGFGHSELLAASQERPSSPEKVMTGDQIHWPVSALPANQLNLKGLNSHVWEWTLDVYHKTGYEFHSRNNPLFTGDSLYQLSNSAINRVERGGSWDSGERFQSCERRQYDPPMERAFFTGFRLVRKP